MKGVLTRSATDRELFRRGIFCLARFDPLMAPVIARWARDDRELFWLAPKTPPPLTAAKVVAWASPDGRPLLFCRDGAMLRTACSQVKAWHESGYAQLKVAVNVSAHQFRERQLLELVPAVLEETALDPHFLEIEVTEETAMQDVDLTIKILAELSRLGVHISIDDFGKGYSSLSYLKCFPTNTLKIDRSFILDVVDNENGSLIASAIIAMAHKLKLNVVAEGVETLTTVILLSLPEVRPDPGVLDQPGHPAHRFARAAGYLPFAKSRLEPIRPADPSPRPGVTLL